MDTEQRSPANNLKLFESGELLSKDGLVSARDALKGKFVGVYFSASWCPPCQRFTPKLVEAYTSSLKDKNLEIVFVSADRDAEAFSSYFSKMPWLAIGYDNKELKTMYNELLDVEGIPTLALFGPDGTLITEEAVGNVHEDPEGKGFPWVPPAVKNINSDDVIRPINTQPCVCVMAEACDESFQQQLLATLEPLCLDASSAVKYFIATEDGPVSEQVGAIAGREFDKSSAVPNTVDIVVLCLPLRRCLVQRNVSAVSADDFKAIAALCKTVRDEPWTDIVEPVSRHGGG